MKKIIINSNTFWSIWNFRKNLIKSLQSDNYQIIILAPHYQNNKNEKKAEKNLLKLNCQIEKINLDRSSSGIFNNLKSIWEYKKLFQKLQPDIILNFTIKPVIYTPLSIYFNKKIKIINNITGLGSSFLQNNFKQKIILFLYKFSQKRANFIFFQNPDNQKFFLTKKIISSQQSDVLPGSGIDLKKFNFQPLIKNEKIIFLFIGRLIKDKGILEFIEGAKFFLQKKENLEKVEFQIIGDFDKKNPSVLSEKKFQESIKNYPQIKYLGFQNNVQNFIIEASCIVLPSYLEGVPRSLLEAIAGGRPIITTDAIGCREVFNKKNGFLVPIKNSQELANAFQKFLNLNFNQQSKMGAHSRELAEKKFDEKIVIVKYQQKILDLIEKN